MTRKNVSKLILGIVIGLFFSSCLTPQKVDKWVSNKYSNFSTPKTIKKNEQIVINSAINYSRNDFASTTTKEGHLLPLVFYWHWNFFNHCTINPQIPINTLKSTFQTYSVKKLKDKIGNNKLELTIEKIPHEFEIHDNEKMIYVILYAISWGSVYLEPKHEDLVVSYKLVDNDGKEIKQGELIEASTINGFTLQYLKSLKRSTAEYLSNYDTHIGVMSKHIIDKLINDL
jgi:hypothetical protein